METPLPDEMKKTMREPLLIAPAASKGGFKTLPFILANEAFERVASVGLVPNMILYLTREYGMETAEAASVIFLWTAAIRFTPILCAFLADSYVGKYPMIGFGSILSFLGMVLLWLTAMFPEATPHCDRFSNICEPPTAPQLVLLYSSFGLMALGAGGIRSSSMAFGADQLEKVADAEALQSYFSWYFATASFSPLIADTVIVYIQDRMGWKMGFGVPVVLMFISALSFQLASSFYVKSKPRTSLFTGLAQVVVASFRNRHIHLPSQATDDEELVFYLGKGSMLHMPSEKLRFLNKACVTKNPQQDITSEGNASNPWSLCTIGQVEELKTLIRVMPLWSAVIMISVNVTQSTFRVIQAGTMDRHITPNFEIPAGSFGTFLLISLVLCTALYDRIAFLASKVKGHSARLSLKQRMGIGLVCSCASMVALAIVEYIRRGIAIQEGHSDEPHAIIHMSALWLVPYDVLGGLALAFTGLAQIQFFYFELPKTMSSIAASLFDAGGCVASLMASFITTTVDNVTKTRGESWLSSNINKGHYDYYYWILAALSMLSFMYFLACCNAYGPCRGDKEGQAQASRNEEIDI